jgi:hypothetical protein
VRALTVLALAAFALPATASQVPAEAGWESSVAPWDVDTVLYFHLINVQDMPVNTQVPTYEAQDTQEVGISSMTLTCLHGTTGEATQGTTSQAFHTYRAYSSPSFVEYDFPGGDGSPRTWPMRGLSYDVLLNQSVQPVLHWFMEEAEQGGLSIETPRTAPLADAVVRVVVHEGDAISVDDKSYDQGRVLMRGETRPVTAVAGQVEGEGSDQVTASQVDGRWVYEFTVLLQMDTGNFSGAHGFTVRIDLVTDVEQCEEGTALMPSPVRPWADATHQPRLLVRNGEPLRVVHAAAVQNDTIRLAWGVQSAWGAYDVAVDEATLEVIGPHGPVEPTLLSVVQRTHEHYHLTEPYVGTWALPADLADGTYTAIFRVPNLQHTSTAEARLTFHVQDGRVVDQEPAEVPAPSLLPLLGLLAIAVIVRRRA